jgi:uncharacterized protein (TIGR03437 family)
VRLALPAGLRRILSATAFVALAALAGPVAADTAASETTCGTPIRNPVTGQVTGVAFPPTSPGWVVISIGTSPTCNGGQPIAPFKYNSIFQTNTPGDGAIWCREIQRAVNNGQLGTLPTGFIDAGPAGYHLQCDADKRTTGPYPTTGWRIDCTQEACVGTRDLPMVNAASFGSSNAYGETERRDNGGGTWGTAPGGIVSGFGWMPKIAPTPIAQTCDPAVGNELAGYRVFVRDFRGNQKRACMLYIGTDLDDASSDRGLKLRYPGQVNFVMPPTMDLNPNPADAKGADVFLIRVSDTRTVSSDAIPVRTGAPGIFMVGNPAPTRFPAAYYTRVRADGSQVTEAVTEPLDVSVAGEEVYLILYGTALRGYPVTANSGTQRAGTAVKAVLAPSPKVWNTPSSRGAARPTIPYQVPLRVDYAGVQNQFVGVDQINIRLPVEQLRAMNLGTNAAAAVVVSIDPAFDAGVKPGNDGLPDRTANSVEIVIKTAPAAAARGSRSAR